MNPTALRFDLGGWPASVILHGQVRIGEGCLAFSNTVALACFAEVSSMGHKQRMCCWKQRSKATWYDHVFRYLRNESRADCPLLYWCVTGESRC